MPDNFNVYKNLGCSLIVSNMFTCRLKDAKEQVVIKEKSCKEGQKAYTKEQSTLKNLQKELTTIEVNL